MTKINKETDKINGVYLQHHGVLCESSSTTIINTIVFYASAKTASAISLNDTLMVAGNLYNIININNIINVILRFFFHAIAITTDLQKMYRQIAIHERNRDYQKRTTTKKVDFSHIFQSLMLKSNFMSNVSS